MAKLILMDLGTGKAKRAKALWAFNPDLRISLDDEKKTVYTADMVSGFLFSVDKNSLVAKRKKWIGPGIRFLACDAIRSKIYVGNYFSGKLFVIDTNSMEVVRSVYTGRRIRTMIIPDNGKHLLFVTSAGAFKLALDEEKE